MLLESLRKLVRSNRLEERSSGAVLLYLVAMLTLVAAAAGGVALMSPLAQNEKLAGIREQQAYYASLSGLSYGKSMAIQGASGALGENWAISTLNGTYSLGNDTSFVLSVTGSTSPYQVASRGIVHTGSANEANYQAVSAVPYTPYVAPPPPYTPRLGDYNFNNPSNRIDYAAYSANQTRDFPTNLDKHDITTKNFVVGKDYKFGFGNIWFTGDRTGISDLGVSSFTKGFRLYFTFQFTTNIGDGFVVSVLNASNNNYGSCGGDSAEGGLLGYAGDSRVYDSSTGEWASKVKEYVDSSGLSIKGLSSPKFGLEIDTYINDSDTWSPDQKNAECTGDNGLMGDLASRSGGGHHVGFDFWGIDKPYMRKSCDGPGTGFKGNLSRYADVRHGVGENASNDATGNGSLKYFSFSTNTTYYFRMDVLPIAGENNYTLKAWVATCNTDIRPGRWELPIQTQCTNQVYGTDTASHSGTLSDTTTDFLNEDIKMNVLKKVYVTDKLKLTADQKKLFNNFMWGITSGSGVATQQIDFRNIGLSLRK